MAQLRSYSSIATGCDLWRCGVNCDRSAGCLHHNPQLIGPIGSVRDLRPTANWSVRDLRPLTTVMVLTQKREKAQEDLYVKQQEKEKLAALRQQLDKLKKETADLEKHLDSKN